MANAQEMAGAKNQIIFLPWLQLAESARVAGIDWVPWRIGRAINPRLRAFDAQLATIFSGYVDIQGEPIRNCTVACIPDGGPNLPDELFDVARLSSSLLFLASWARNSYFQQIDFSYVNSSLFRLVGQRFSGEPVYIALGSRRRDGQTLDGGYAHGEVRFTAPLQCRLDEICQIDLEFLGALDRADKAGSQSLLYLRRALPFVELANSDDDFMTPMPEAILMAAAFEQLLVRNEESSARRVDLPPLNRYA